MNADPAKFTHGIPSGLSVSDWHFRIAFPEFSTKKVVVNRPHAIQHDRIQGTIKDSFQAR